MGSEHDVCPTCGQHVATVVKRHKTLGAWVPTWTAGPCHNPDCSAYAEPDTEPGGEHSRRPEEPRRTEPVQKPTGTP
ncbi:hypothetical protein [Streptomyces sp. NPDC006997]|uniref:hypothetical protein n=1 Tax=Streptomyces sp. NPDC006997 TaxID=3155356 RepID=UPI003410C5DD